MLRATELRKGQVIVMDGKLVRVTDYNHVTPGNLRGIVHIKYKDIQTGIGSQARLRPEDKIEDAFLEQRPMEYLYAEGDGYVFMDVETYEQPTIPKGLIEDMMVYIRPNDKVQISFFEGTPATIDLPSSVIMEVIETEPAVRGDTVQNVTKPAKTDTGLETKVPNHIRVGDKVKIDTRTGDFIERVNQ